LCGVQKTDRGEIFCAGSLPLLDPLLDITGNSLSMLGV
jgi:hypothetical protein